MDRAKRTETPRQRSLDGGALQRKQVGLALLLVILLSGLIFTGSLNVWADDEDKPANEVNLSPGDPDYDPKAPRSQGLMPTLPPGYNKDGKKAPAADGLKIKARETIKPAPKTQNTPAVKALGEVQARQAIERPASPEPRKKVANPGKLKSVNPVKRREPTQPRPH